MSRIRRHAVWIIALIAAFTVPAEVATASDPSGEMIEEINKVRARYGLPGLSASPSLQRSSGAFSRRLMATNRFGHGSRVSASRGFRRLGEVLAFHRGGRTRIRRTVRNWLGSAAHRAILFTRMRYVGAGVTSGRFGRRRATIWVLQVGSR
jgi:uncharacterized protein YkwD